MGEQKQYTRILQKIIDQTENLNIQSSEQLMQELINELKDASLITGPVVNK